MTFDLKIRHWLCKQILYLSTEANCIDYKQANQRLAFLVKELSNELMAIFGLITEFKQNLPTYRTKKEELA